MSPNPPFLDASPPAAPRLAWVMVGLLFLIQMVNYIDKSVVSLVAAPMMHDLGLSPSQYGLIASSFFSLYGIGGLVVAFGLVPWVRPRFLILAMLILWSVLQLPIIFAASMSTLVLCRTLLGAAEGGATPTGINTCYEWFENDRRNLPTAILLTGSTIGSLVAPPIMVSVIDSWGWRVAFSTCAVLGAALAVAWLVVSRDGPGSAFAPGVQIARTERPPTPSHVWLQRTTIGCVIAGSCSFWVVGFTVAWLPVLIETHLGFSRIATGWILSTCYLTQGVMSLSIGWLTDARMRVGGSSRKWRGISCAACLLGCGTAFGLAAFAGDRIAQLSFIALAMGLAVPPFTFLSALISEVTPAGHRQKVQTVVLSLISFVAAAPPLIGGQLIEGSGSGWATVLMLNGLICAFGAVASFLLMRPDSARHT